MTSNFDAELVGRDRELSVLAGLLDRLLAGRGGVVWVEGEPGIGKTALVEHLVSRSRGSGCVTRAARADEFGNAFPLRLFADCLGVSLRSNDVSIVEIARLLRGDLTVPGAVEPVAAAGERMLEVIDRLCAQGPVVLVTEDLHWADDASLALWSRLARSVDQIPLLLVGSCRPVPLRSALARLSMTVRDAAGAVVSLGPLSLADAVGFACRRLEASPGPELSRELSRAGGNPLYLRELVDALVVDGSVGVVDGVAELVEGAATTPMSFVTALSRRLGFLSEQTLKALRMAAILGSDFAVVEWAAVAERSPVELGEAVEEAIAAGVLVTGERGMAFRHDLIRQVLVEQTPPALRRLIQRNLARTLAAGGGGADEVARRLLAGPALDDWALTWLADLQESMVFTAPDLFEKLLLRAFRQLADGDLRWEVLASRLAQVQYRMGHDELAAATSMAVLGRTTEVELAGLMRVQAVRARGRLAQFEAAVALAEPALDDPTVPPHWRARLRAWAARGIYSLGRVNEAYQQALTALDEAMACGDQLGAGYARCQLMGLSTGEERRAHAELALAELGNDAESTDLRVLILCRYLNILENDGTASEVDALLPQALVTAERLGTARSYWVPMQAASLLFLRGDWDECLRYAAMIPDTVEPLVPALCATRTEIALRRERRDIAEEYLRAAGVPEHVGHPPFDPAVRAMAPQLMLRAFIDGDNERALLHGKDLLANPDPDLMGDAFLTFLVRIALAVGDVDTARTATKWATEHEWSELSGVRCCQALIDDDMKALEDAVRQYERRGWRTLQAFALEELAVLSARTGADAPARDALAQAVQLYTDFGATMDIRRARSRLIPFGIRVGHRSLVRRATHGWEALTSAEERVATLVGEGLSNPDIAARLFVSRTTVQTHVSRILAKLDMKSRVELIKTVKAGAR